MIRVNLVIKRKGESLSFEICDVNINYIREDIFFPCSEDEGMAALM